MVWLRPRGRNLTKPRHPPSPTTPPADDAHVAHGGVYRSQGDAVGLGVGCGTGLGLGGGTMRSDGRDDGIVRVCSGRATGAGSGSNGRPLGTHDDLRRHQPLHQRCAVGISCAAGAAGRRASQRRRGAPKPILRIGEATNPGPPAGAVVDGAVVFRSPEQPGFWHQHLPSPDQHRGGRDDDLLALTVDTVNSTSWGPLSRYLLTTGAHVLLCQEHHLGPHEVPAAAAFALRHGWQVVMLPT